MPRTALASTAAALTLLIAGLAPISADASTKHSSASCASTRSSAAPRHGTRSYRFSGCSKGSGRVRHGARVHLLFFTAHDGVCPDAKVQPNTHNVAIVRAATLCLINRERAAHGEHALHWNLDLVHAAQAHTRSMAYHDYFAHIGRSGTTPLERIRRSGYIYSSSLGFEVGENIAWGSLWLGTPRAIVATWMASPGHRANILDARFRDTGIGVSPHLGALAGGQSGGIYTQDFGVLVG